MAANLEWTPAYSVGVDALDDDHRDMIGRADDLIAAYRAGRPEAELRDGLDDLLELAVDHFENEERFMAEADYPGLRAHVDDHNRLLRNFLKCRADIRYRRLEPDEMAELVIDWVLRHIKDEDLRYKAFLDARRAR